MEINLQPIVITDVNSTLNTMAIAKNNNVPFGTYTMHSHLIDHDYIYQRPKPSSHAKKRKRRLKITDIKAIYNCLVCGYRTMNRDVLQKHVCIKDLNYDLNKNLTKKLPKKYEICSKSAEKSNLRNRTESQDRGIQNKCIDCVTPKINVETLKYKCSKCSYTSQNLTNLKIHTHIHSRGALYKCTECEFSGADLKQLIKHYDDVKEMQCQCGYSTHVKQQMSMHMRSHTGEKPFSCGICNFATSDRAGLHRHMKTKHVME
ncbi:unnamed protein product [Arctia plantaginis]|uniref:C2H2-type domain-containing protein n=1 Tax=Arctia plantaginis TaxID=874455 RepID=A0A8S0YSV2_ARCPL|nr:unnamed protein product [Arctia plantaginis]